MSSKNIINNLRRIQEKDCRSNFGSNISNICRINNTMDILACVKDAVKYFPIDDTDFWQVNLLKELISVRNNTDQLEGFSLAEINYYIENVAFL